MANQLGQPMRPHSGSRAPYGDDVSAGRVCWPSFGWGILHESRRVVAKNDLGFDEPRAGLAVEAEQE